MDKSKVLLVFLGGLAVGTVIGMLLAPEKGSETRQKLMDMADEVSDTVGESLHTVVDKMKSQFGDRAKEAGSTGHNGHPPPQGSNI